MATPTWSRPRGHALTTCTDMSLEEEAVPEELEEQCVECHHALGSVERLLNPILGTNHAAIEEKMTPLDNATLTLLMAYTVNSLFWAYLNTKGIAPKSHPVKTELDRIQKYMHKANVISQRERGEVPRVNTGVAKRFIRSSLWEKGESSNTQREEDEQSNTPDNGNKAKRPKCTN